jgi:hypothetical protein
MLLLYFMFDTHKNITWCQKVKLKETHADKETQAQTWRLLLTARDIDVIVSAE